MYKKSLFDNNRFNDKTKICEDLELLYKIFYKCKKITYIPDKLYVWFSRENSTTKQKYNNAWRGEINICDQIISFTEENCPKVKQYAIKRYIRVILSCFLIIDQNFDKSFEELRIKLMKHRLRKKSILPLKRRVWIFIIIYIPYIAKKILKFKIMIERKKH